MTVLLKGLSWGHRRATAPMMAAAEQFRQLTPDTKIIWEEQPLGGFEHGLSTNLVDGYDLIVFDHPFCGSIVRDRLLRPLDDVSGSLEARSFIGSSLESYRYAGHLWGLPIDGAAHVALYRQDLLAPFGEVPACWTEVLDLGRRVRRDGRWLSFATVSPHAFLVLLAICADLCFPWSVDPWAEPFDEATVRAAAAMLKAFLAHVHPDCLAFNAIDLHEAMAVRDDLVYCPAVYGYLTYGEPGAGFPLAFCSTPTVDRSGSGGSVLGGTGLGITRSCRDIAAATDFLAMLADGSGQIDMIARHHGQPAHIDAWNDADADERFGGAFSGTRDVTTSAWVRPRFPDYIRVQAAAGALTELFCLDKIDDAELAKGLRDIWQRLGPPIDSKTQ